MTGFCDLNLKNFIDLDYSDVYEEFKFRAQLSMKKVL